MNVAVDTWPRPADQHCPAPKALISQSGRGTQVTRLGSVGDPGVYRKGGCSVPGASLGLSVHLRSYRREAEPRGRDMVLTALSSLLDPAVPEAHSPLACKISLIRSVVLLL